MIDRLVGRHLDRYEGRSRWALRKWAFALALTVAVIAAYLALYELHWISSVWDPIFGKGSDAVLNSNVSRAFPIPDALLGLGAYLLEGVLIFAGGDTRWRDRPWLVIANAIMAALLAVTGLILVLLQVLVIDAWCSLCLVTAAISLIIACPVARELAATIWFLRRESDTGGAVRPLIRGM